MASLIERNGVYYIQYCVSGKARRVTTGTESLQLAKEKLRQFQSAQMRGEENPLPTKTPIPVIVSAYVAHIRTVKTAKSAQTDKLPTMPLSEEVSTDYQTAGLSLKAHPIALIRNQLAARRIIRAIDLNDIPQGKWVKVAGLVLIRQRPSTASGIVFETIEDETGVVNLIIRPRIFDRFRAAARHASLVEAEGLVERQGQVIHVMVGRMTDLSTFIVDHDMRSRDFH